VYQTLRQQRYKKRKAERVRIAVPLLGENDGAKPRADHAAGDGVTQGRGAPFLAAVQAEDVELPAAVYTARETLSGPATRTFCTGRTASSEIQGRRDGLGHQWRNCIGDGRAAGIARSMSPTSRLGPSPRHSKDNGLVESKNGAVMRKHAVIRKQMDTRTLRRHMRPSLLRRVFQLASELAPAVRRAREEGERPRQGEVYPRYATLWEGVRQLPRGGRLAAAS
jgi:hypothetical protein